MRDYNVTPQLPPNGFTVAELFCGGGLMAVGIQAAGYYIKFANDFDSKPVQAYKHNIGDHVLMGDITSPDVQSRIPDTDIIAGGPPCQDYSVAGTGEGEEGERGKLVWTYLGIIEDRQPKAFVFENVKGLIQKKHRHTFDALLQRFDEIGYNVSWQLINAWDYGVAQKRERVFIVGIRKDLGFEFEFPQPRPEEYRTQVLRNAIGDLPEPHGIELSEKALIYMERDPRHYQKHKPAEYDSPVPTLPAVLHKGVPYGLFYPDNHDPENHTLSQKAIEGAQRRKARGGGGNHSFRIQTWDGPCDTISSHIAKDATNFVHPSCEKSLFGPKSVEAYKQACTTANLSNHVLKPVGDYEGYESRTRRREMDDVSYTVDTRWDINYVHPNKPRRFTVRECLRIQSVPDWYVLPSDISLSAQYRIVGNGVASRVAYVIGVALAKQLHVALSDKHSKAV